MHKKERKVNKKALFLICINCFELKKHFYSLFLYIDTTIDRV